MAGARGEIPWERFSPGLCCSRRDAQQKAIHSGAGSTRRKGQRVSTYTIAISTFVLCARGILYTELLHTPTIPSTATESIQQSTNPEHVPVPAGRVSMLHGAEARVADPVC